MKSPYNIYCFRLLFKGNKSYYKFVLNYVYGAIQQFHYLNTYCKNAQWCDGGAYCLKYKKSCKMNNGIYCKDYTKGRDTMKTTSYIYRLVLEYYANAVYNMRKTCTYYHGVNHGLLLKSVTACHMCAIASDMILKGEY